MRGQIAVILGTEIFTIATLAEVTSGIRPYARCHKKLGEGSYYPVLDATKWSLHVAPLRCACQVLMSDFSYEGCVDGTQQRENFWGNNIVGGLVLCRKPCARSHKCILFASEHNGCVRQFALFRGGTWRKSWGRVNKPHGPSAIPTVASQRLINGALP